MYYGRDSFLSNRRDRVFQGKNIKPQGNSIQAQFNGLKPGKYAVAVYHDENNNGDLDTNLVGIPNEAYGFSNNASGLFGPPAFEDAGFEIWDNQPLIIEINID